MTFTITSATDFVTGTTTGTTGTTEAISMSVQPAIGSTASNNSHA